MQRIDNEHIDQNGNNDPSCYPKAIHPLSFHNGSFLNARLAVINKLTPITTNNTTKAMMAPFNAALRIKVHTITPAKTKHAKPTTITKIANARRMKPAGPAQT